MLDYNNMESEFKLINTNGTSQDLINNLGNLC